MINPQLYPLEVNPITGEPFLRLTRHGNIIITPPRAEDAPRMLGPMNDERVHIWLGSPPYPYLLAHAETWIAKIKGKTDSILEELESARDKAELIVTDGCPVRFLREIREDGSELFIGDVGIFRCNYGEMLGPDGVDWDSKAKYEAENNSLPVGDPGIVWTIGGKTRQRMQIAALSEHGRFSDCQPSRAWDNDGRGWNGDRKVGGRADEEPAD